MTNMPKSVTKYFWGDDLTKLSWDNHQNYITKTILEKGDAPAVHWLLKNIPKDSLLRSLPDFQLSPKSANFWKVYLT